MSITTRQLRSEKAIKTSDDVRTAAGFIIQAVPGADANGWVANGILTLPALEGWCT